LEARADRREALVKLLRLGGLSAGAAGLAVWLNSRGGIEEAPVAAPRKPNFGVPADARLPNWWSARGMALGNWCARGAGNWVACGASSRTETWSRSSEHRLGPHAATGRQH